MNKPGTAAVLSFFIPGLGQLYNGDFFRGFLWFLGALVFGLTIFVGSMGVPSLIYHVICAWAAYSRASSKGHAFS